MVEMRVRRVVRTYDGDWVSLANQAGVSMVDMRHFLEYAAIFLANIGNYYVSSESLSASDALFG